jgi:TPP-dependent pyruvate/acetoin dehydrogenase alpha subunit
MQAERATNAARMQDMPATAAGLKDLYQSMVLIREAEEAVLRLFSQNRMPGFFHSYIGEEAGARVWW